MKKKMGILCGLLAAVAVTGYSVAGTYAKYTSSFDYADSARVAKWTFEKKENEVNIFAKDYEDVTSTTEKNVVAPGTSNQVTAVIEGAVETKYKLQFNVTDEDGNILLVDPTVYYFEEAGKTYAGTKADELYELDANGVKVGDKVDLIGKTVEQYHPVEYAIAVDGWTTAGTKITADAEGNLPFTDAQYTDAAGIKNAFDVSNAREDAAAIYDPTDKAHHEFTIAWRWKFENGHDVLDTFLGRYLSEDANVGDLKVTVTAVQVNEK